jgi:hypothetical protein
MPNSGLGDFFRSVGEEPCAAIEDGGAAEIGTLFALDLGGSNVEGEMASSNHPPGYAAWYTDEVGARV